MPPKGWGQRSVGTHSAVSPRGCHRPCHIPGQGEGFVPPHSSARGSSGSTRSLLLLWIYRALQTGTRRPWAVPFPANWVCFLGTVSPQSSESSGGRPQAWSCCRGTTPRGRNLPGCSGLLWLRWGQPKSLGGLPRTTAAPNSLVHPAPCVCKG